MKEKRVSGYSLSFSEHFREALEEYGFSAADFAEQSGMPQKVVSDYLRCEREVTVADLILVSEFFGVSIKKFIPHGLPE